MIFEGTVIVLLAGILACLMYAIWHLPETQQVPDGRVDHVELNQWQPPVKLPIPFDEKPKDNGALLNPRIRPTSWTQVKNKAEMGEVMK